MPNKNRKLDALFKELDQEFTKNCNDLEVLPMLPSLTLAEIKMLLSKGDKEEFYTQREEEETTAITKLSQLQKLILIILIKRLMRGEFRLYWDELLRLTFNDRISIEVPTWSRTIKRLEERGIIQRHPPGKTEYITLTELGIRAGKRLTQSIAEASYSIKNG